MFMANLLEFYPALSLGWNESGLPDSRAGARLRQQPFSLGAKCASPGGFCFIGNEVSYKATESRMNYISGFFHAIFKRTVPSNGHVIADASILHNITAVRDFYSKM